MFSEYCRNALRMCALMKLPNIFVFTHDSIGVGEDGPTHQPVEQTATLRLIPGMSVWRPADAVESAMAWKLAVERVSGPSCLIFSRQGLQHQERSKDQLADIAHGGYILHEPDKAPVAIIIAAGSEVGMAMQAAQSMNDKGTPVRVVSMPSTDVFDSQDDSYKESVLPKALRARVAIEAGSTDGWRKYVGLDGDVMGIDTYGESGPADEVYEHFGLNAGSLAARVQACISQKS